MSALLVVFMVLGTGVAHHTTTFLRLTALRSDQGVWTARFGEYEISIELRHHVEAGQVEEYNDTWTVKVKHTPKQSVLWNEKDDEENEFLGGGSQDSGSEDDSPRLQEIQPLPRKSRRGKKRRQLSNKHSTTTTTPTTTTEKRDVTELVSSNKEVALSELAEGSTRINVVFDKAANDNATETYEDGQWKNVAAVMYDSLRMADQEIRHDEDVGRLDEPYALPLQQTYHSTTQVDGQTFASSSKETGDESKRDTDYVIEDAVVSSSVGSDEETKGVEGTPEMKRLAQWYPNSKPLASDNNGYKLFPGVGWFKLVPWAERWSNASKVCDDEGAHLAVPDSREKVAIFLHIFKNYPDVLEQSILSSQVYVGVYNIGVHHREFHTVQGELFEPDFPIWFPGQPDNADPGEDCVTFHRRGKIRDVPCFYNLPFLCEKAPDIS